MISEIRSRILDEFARLDNATTEEMLAQTKSKMNVSVFSKQPVGPSKKVQEVYEKMRAGYNIPS